MYPVVVSAQPGGGGGLFIRNMYNRNLKPVDLSNDPQIFIRTFVLLKGKVYQETFLHDQYMANNGKMRVSRSYYGFGLPPAGDVDGNGYGDRQSDQRMMIIYNRDTMVIDFTGITGENAGGYTDVMDSLVIQPGYFTYDRSRLNNSTGYNIDEWKALAKLQQNGLTPFTIQQLRSKKLIRLEAKIDLSFLQKGQLPASFYFKRAAYYLQHNKPSQALADIRTAIEKNQGRVNCEALYLLTGAYTALGQYQDAIDHISSALECRQNAWEDAIEAKAGNYRTRIDLLIHMGRYQEALNDHNTIVSMSEDKMRPVIDRAQFKQRYMHDAVGSKNDLLEFLSSIPGDHLSDRPQGTSEYTDVYFVLAGIEYSTNDIINAAKHWLKAEEFGYSVSSDEAAVRHFDSVIKAHPQLPELYLCRALAEFKRGPYLGWGRETKACFEKALTDINRADQTGMKDYRIHMYRARVLTLLQRYEDALKEIDIAILENNTDPRCYLFRYEIRSNLGQTKYGDNNDTDYQRYLQLAKQWRWDNY